MLLAALTLLHWIIHPTHILLDLKPVKLILRARMQWVVSIQT